MVFSGFFSGLFAKIEEMSALLSDASELRGPRLFGTFPQTSSFTFCEGT